MSGFFYNLGRQVGRKAVPAIRKSKYIWDGFTGTEEEALRAEIALGHELATELRALVAPGANAADAALVAGICERLSACVRNKARKFQCEVIHDTGVNAMGLPGGFIFLSDSLLTLCEGESDELAFAIGHEMAHVIRGHAWDRMLHETVLRFASTVTARSGALAGWVRQHGIALLRNSYSRDAEIEADELGYRLATAAGFSPQGSILLLQRVGRVRETAVQPGEYITSHPASSERIARVQAIR